MIIKSSLAEIKYIGREIRMIKSVVITGSIQTVGYPSESRVSDSLRVFFTSETWPVVKSGP